MDFSEYSVPIWIIKKGIKNEKSEPFEFRDHLFLYDILRDMSPEQAIKKCSQVGVSVSMNLKVFHVAKYRKMTSIYTMPSDSDVEEFSKTKTDKIFQANKCIRDSIDLDNVFLKEVNGTFIYFKGTRSKSAPISTTADVLIHDEKDRSDLKIVEGYQSRTTASKYRGTWSLSNPSQYGVGIDVDWQNSDKKEWFIKCGKCGEEQFLTWEDNVDEIRMIYVCKNCGKEFTDNERRLGKWKPTSQGRISGYHISQMMAPWMSAANLIKEKNKTGIEYFRNFILGEPYSIGDVSDFSTMILDSWTPESLDDGRLFLGIDIGKEKHWVLGNSKGIFKIGKCEKREQVEELLKKYNPITVMDSGPERTWAEEFKQKYPNLWICFYRRDKEEKDLVLWGGEKNSKEEYKKLGYVWIDRNRVVDATVNSMMRGEILFGMDREYMERFIEHWQTMRRFEEVNSIGQKKYVWESTTGVNHWASATWFYWVARQRGSMGTEFINEPTADNKKLIQVTSDGMQMRDLKDIFDEMNQ